MGTEANEKPSSGCDNQHMPETPRRDQVGSAHKQSGSVLNENAKTCSGTTELLFSKASLRDSLENTPSRLAHPPPKDHGINILLVDNRPLPRGPVSAGKIESFGRMHTDPKTSRPQILIERLLGYEQVSPDNAEKNPTRPLANEPPQLLGVENQG